MPARTSSPLTASLLPICHLNSQVPQSGYRLDNEVHAVALAPATAQHPPCLHPADDVLDHGTPLPEALPDSVLHDPAVGSSDRGCDPELTPVAPVSDQSAMPGDRLLESLAIDDHVVAVAWPRLADG